MNIHVTKLGFKKFYKLVILIFFSIGLLIGLLFFAASLLGANVTATLFVTKFSGIMGGTISLFLVPLMTTLFAAIVSPMAYLPFRWLLRISGGISIQPTNQPTEDREKESPAIAAGQTGVTR
jgi:hypothetical protein